MSRERLPEKAVRLLATGRVVVERASRERAVVVVQGDHGRYGVTLDRGGASCSCPAWTARCSHARAALLVARRREA